MKVKVTMWATSGLSARPVNVFYSFDQAGIWQSDEADLAADFGQQPGDIRINDVNGRDEDGELTKQTGWKYQCRRPKSPGLYGTQLVKEV